MEKITRKEFLKDDCFSIEETEPKSKKGEPRKTKVDVHAHFHPPELFRGAR